MEQMLKEFVERLKAGAGHNLKSVALYGSSASSDGLPSHRNELGILCLLERAGVTELGALSPAVIWWVGHHTPTPQIFTLAELERSADVYAIELLDMKRHHRILFGDDFLTHLEIPMDLHRLQVERDLRTSWLRLRQGVLLARGNKKLLAGLMSDSVLRFAGLFRHALMALGETPPDTRHETVDHIGRMAGADSTAFQTALNLRAEKAHASDVDVPAAISGYLPFIERVTDEVDRRLESQSPVAQARPVK